MTPSSDSPYDVLGVAKDATADQIRKAYRKLARENHPDVNPSDEAAERRFKAASAANEVLSDPAKRALYDEFGHDATRAGFDPETARAYKRWQGDQSAGAYGPGAVLDGDFDLEGLFGDLLKGRSGARRAPVPRRGADVHTSLQVALEEVARGSERTVRLTRPERCPPCKGCRGSGVVERTATLKIKVPAGVEPGQKLRLAGQGAAGRHGGPAGDLLVEVQVAPHPTFKREGHDLHLELPITVPEALLGARVDVPTLSGEVTLAVPPGSSSGRKLRLRGKGLSGRGGAKGDLYVTLQVVVPEASPDDPAVREAAKALAALYPTDVRSALKSKRSRRAG